MCYLMKPHCDETNAGKSLCYPQEVSRVAYTLVCNNYMVSIRLPIVYNCAPVMWRFILTSNRTCHENVSLYCMKNSTLLLCLNK